MDDRGAVCKRKDAKTFEDDTPSVDRVTCVIRAVRSWEEEAIVYVEGSSEIRHAEVIGAL